ncbi:hypothetical protein SCOR_04345 [Sulfidibacter corallicola]
MTQASHDLGSRQRRIDRDSVGAESRARRRQTGTRIAAANGASQTLDRPRPTLPADRATTSEFREVGVAVDETFRETRPRNPLSMREVSLGMALMLGARFEFSKVSITTHPACKFRKIRAGRPAAHDPGPNLGRDHRSTSVQNGFACPSREENRRCALKIPRGNRGLNKPARVTGIVAPVCDFSRL